MAAAFVSLSAALFFNASAQADTTSQLLQCNKLYAKQKVIQCCDQVVQQRHRPIWMIDNNLSCGTAVTCVSTLAPAKTRKYDGASSKPKYIVGCNIIVKFKGGEGTSVKFTPSAEPKYRVPGKTDTQLLFSDK